MNKDQMKGSVKEAAGKMERKAGNATDSTEHQIKGAGRELAGKAQKAYGDAKSDAKSQDRHAR